MMKQPIYPLILLSFLGSGLFLQCQDIPPVASQLVYVSAVQNDMARRPSTECAFRYSIVNAFPRLDDNSQREAIRAGFELWQKVNPNLGFLELPERPVLLVKFVDPTEIPNPTTTTSVGIVRGSALVTSGLRRDNSGTYTIVLSNTFAWNKNSLTKAIAYHAGLFLGMATSAESSSLMSTLFIGQYIAASKADSVAISKLYTTPCKNLNVSYLPFKLQVNGPITKTVRFDKQGIVSIKASGQINVGIFVGLSGPEGKLDGGLFSFPLADFNIVKDMFHAALMYKINNESQWHYCGKECNFSTAGNQYVDLLFNINDSNLTDNGGFYDVVVDYK